MKSAVRFYKAAAAGLIAVSPLFFAASAQGQRGSGQRGGDSSQNNTETEEGIPVTNPLVISKCGTCHAKDDKGNLSRISWERATPEGWEEAIKRMVRLNGLTISPEDARSILKYLATYHGLAPEEAKPVMYMPEHRMVDETNIPNDTVRGACTTCHAMGRPLSWRRSKYDWKLLANLHVALYAQAEAHFRRSLMSGPGGGGSGSGGGGGRGAAAAAANAAAGGGGAGSTPANGTTPTGGSGASGADGDAANRGPEPLDVALDFLGTSAPLHTPEWAAWRTRMRSPKLAGKWLVSAHIAGRGKYFGEMVVEPGPVDDEFKTRVTLRSVKDGSKLVRSGKGLVYAGYAWRGRSKGASPAGNAPDDVSREMREALWFSPDQIHAEGRWFWGEYQEFGVDVKLTRASSEPTLLGTDVDALKIGSQAARVRLIGDSFPAQIALNDVDLGAGVKVNKIVSHNPGEVVVEASVASDALPGKRDVVLQRSVLQNSLAAYDRIDYIKVVPEAALARLGSDVHPKGYQQFEAVAYHRGADGKLHTADDVELGPIDVDWTVEEFMSVYGDDDKYFVGQLSPTALFTPASDGPNPERKFGRNNYGDVWVVATAKNEKDKDGKPISGRSYLVVTVPTYIRWDQPEVEQ